MLKRIEILLLVSAVVAINLHLLLWSGAELISIIAFSGLALLYPFLSMALFINDSQSISITSMIPGLTFSIVLVGMMFKLQMWPGFQANLVIGIIGLLILIIYSFTLKDPNQKAGFKVLRKRAIPMVIIAIITLMLPKYTWLETKYSKYPVYIETVKQLDKNPDNLQIQQRIDSLQNHLIK
jgi:hypothetical protein